MSTARSLTSLRVGRLVASLVALPAVLGALALAGPAHAAPAASLEQCRTGAAATPSNCQALGANVGWVNGNAGASNSHYVEGYSIPYRTLMTDLPTGTPVTITLGYDIKHSSAHALDFLTHYNRLESHLAFGHPAETISPLSGVVGVSATTSTFPIPAPSSTGSPVAGQPTTRFNSLPAGERVMTLFGGTISAVSYVTQGSLTASQSETTISVTFTPDSATAVLAWGGHIARTADWGAGNAATGINGSPYHMRLKSWTLDNLGNQDRSMVAAAVQPTGTVTIRKVAQGGNGTFSFTGTGTGVASAFDTTTTAGQGERVFTEVLTGTKTVTESGPPAGWTLTGIACTGDSDGGGSTSLADRRATIDLDANENIVCTFTNTRAASIIVEKQTAPDATAGSFAFTGNASGSISDGGQIVVNNLQPGTYTSSETVPNGWELTGISCDDGNSTGSTTTGTATFQVEAGETVKCVFTNSKVNLTVTKTPDGQTVNAGDPISFTVVTANTGPGTAKSVTLNDPLPAGVDWSIQTHPAGNPCSITGNVDSEVLACTFGDLASGQSRSVTVTATTSFANCTAYNNTATASATNTPNASNSGDITCRKPNLSVTKTPDGQTVSAGDPIGFAIVTANAGPGTAKAVTLNDPLPDGVDWSISGQPAGSPAPCAIGGTGNDQVLACTFGDLTSGESRSVTVTATTSFANCAVYNNTATASASNHPDASDSGGTTCNKPNLSVAKTPDGQTVNAGDPISFTIVTANAGPGTAKAVTLNDPLPDGVNWSITNQPAGDPAPCVISGTGNDQVLACAFGDVASEQSRSVTVSAQTSGANCSILNNEATSSASNHPSVADQGSITVDCRPDYIIEKSAPASVDTGEPISYTITVRHTGDAAPVQLPGQLLNVYDRSGSDAEIKLDRIAVVPTDANGPAVDTDDLLEPNETWVYGLNGAPLTKTATGCGQIVNVATARIEQAPAGQPTAQAVVPPISEKSDDAQTQVICTLDVGIGKAASHQTIDAGGEITYTLTVTNSGQQAIPFGQIQVTDPMFTPQLSGTAPAELAPGASLTYTGKRTTTVNDCAAGVTNTATVALVGNSRPETTTANNTATAKVNVVCPAPSPVQIAGAPAKLGIDKQGPLTATAGQPVTYRIKVTNTGQQDALNVIIRDTLPSGYTLARRAAGARLRGGVVTWRVGTLKPGASKSVQLTVRIDRSISGRRCNVGAALGSNVGQVRDAACTRIKAVAAAVTPAVTG